MNSIEQKCKKRSKTYRSKKARKIMSESKDHPDVDELHKRVAN